jgi:lysophospholipase L1-like esterase
VSKRSVSLANLSLALFSVLLTLGVIELALRWLHPVPYATERNMYYIADPFTGYRLSPFGKGQFSGGIPANANLHGHRSEEVSLFKEPDVFRILVLGDSFTVGASVHQHESYPAQLQRMLERTTQQRIEVINTAVGGWGPFQYAQYFAHYGLEFSPDMVIVGLFVGNDISDAVESIARLPTAAMGRRISRKASRDPLISLRVALHEASHLARLVLHQARPLLDFSRERCDEFPAVFVQIQRHRAKVYRTDWKSRDVKLARVTRQISRIDAYAREVGIPLLVVLIPDESQTNPALGRLLFKEGDPVELEQPQRLLEERFAAKGIETLDLLPAFRARPDCLHLNDTHWTPDGHRLAAEEILRVIAPRVSAGLRGRRARVSRKPYPEQHPGVMINP